MPDQFVLVLTTTPASGDLAERIARTLVNERLVACANLLAPMQSIYRWKDAVEADDERQIVMKTTQGKVGDLWKRLRELHPYEVPEFIVLTIADGSNAYLEWIRASTTAPPQPEDQDQDSDRGLGPRTRSEDSG